MIPDAGEHVAKGLQFVPIARWRLMTWDGLGARIVNCVVVGDRQSREPVFCNDAIQAQCLPPHRIGKMKLKVTNWAEYEASLRRRGSLTLWVTPEALSCWRAPKRTTRRGQPRYSDLAIGTALALGLVFGLRLRQTEGFLTSVLKLTGLDLAVPDHPTLSRRAGKPRAPNKLHDDRIPERGPVHVLIDSTGLQVYGAGQWLEERHGVKSRRG